MSVEINEAVVRLIWASPEELTEAAQCGMELIGRMPRNKNRAKKRAQFFIALQDALDLYKEA